jgi:hypothetical protein
MCAARKLLASSENARSSSDNSTGEKSTVWLLS